jgi:hypothetical protein
MADEIRNQNVATVSADGHLWVAVLGPDPVRGLVAYGGTPTEALHRLASRAHRAGWVFGRSYVPKKDPGFHDA